MDHFAQRFLNGLANLALYWIAFVPLISIVISVLCGDMPRRVLLRSIGFGLLAVFVVIVFPWNDRSLALVLTTAACVLIAVWYAIKVFRKPEVLNKLSDWKFARFFRPKK